MLSFSFPDVPVEVFAMVILMVLWTPSLPCGEENLNPCTIVSQHGLACDLHKSWNLFTVHVGQCAHESWIDILGIQCMVTHAVIPWQIYPRDSWGHEVEPHAFMHEHI